MGTYQRYRILSVEHVMLPAHSSLMMGPSLFNNRVNKHRWTQRGRFEFDRTWVRHCTFTTVQQDLCPRQYEAAQISLNMKEYIGSSKSDSSPEEMKPFDTGAHPWLNSIIDNLTFSNNRGDALLHHFLITW